MVTPHFRGILRQARELFESRLKGDFFNAKATKKPTTFRQKQTKKRFSQKNRLF
jgi:hypothetical protein